MECLARSEWWTHDAEAEAEAARCKTGGFQVMYNYHGVSLVSLSCLHD
jgi:hypothetical protein